MGNSLLRKYGKMSCVSSNLTNQEIGFSTARLGFLTHNGDNFATCTSHNIGNSPSGLLRGVTIKAISPLLYLCHWWIMCTALHTNENWALCQKLSLLVSCFTFLTSSCFINQKIVGSVPIPQQIYFSYIHLNHSHPAQFIENVPQ